MGIPMRRASRQPPPLFDVRAAQAARLRARRIGGERFLEDAALEGLADRLSPVARRFGHGLWIGETVPAAIRPFAENWSLADFDEREILAAGEDRWRVTFPSARSDCRALAGNCKCAFTEPYAMLPKVVIGDGRSDHCVAQRADVVFAKAELLALCRGSSTPHFAFADFYEVGDKLAVWLGQEHPLPRGEAVGAGSART